MPVFSQLKPASGQPDGLGPLLLTDRQRSAADAVLLLNVVGLLAGWHVLYNQWLHAGWFLAWTTVWLAVAGPSPLLEPWRCDPWVRAVGGLMLALLVRSTLLPSPGATAAAIGLGWANAGLLATLLLLVWLAAKDADFHATAGRPMVVAAAFAAGVSMGVFYGLHPDALFGARLRNWLVFGGWNSVCTGLTFGFAAVWGTALWNRARDVRDRRLWLALTMVLLAATLFTLSRGALLALLCAHGVALLVCGWRLMWRPILLLLVALTLFLGLAPWLNDVALTHASTRFGLENRTAAAEQMADHVISPRPVEAMLRRGDTQRFEIYEAAIASLRGGSDWLLGKGLWSSNDQWSCALSWEPEHLHGIFMDALVRGGLPVLGGLLAVTVWGLRRAWCLARQGEEVWLMLACFGVAGVVFDGDTAFALLSVPRFEPLIFWVPLAAAAARYQARSLSNARGHATF